MNKSIKDRRSKIVNCNNGLTIVEMLVSIAILAIMAGLFTQLIYGALESWRYNMDKEKLLRDGQRAMEMIVNSIRDTKWVLIPIKNDNPRDILAISAGIDNDSDGFIDEDPGSDITNDGQPGIAYIDDDGDRVVDEGGPSNDDEDGPVDEDCLNWIDNDLDGGYDEDPSGDLYGQGYNDDDNDGIADEDWFDPRIFRINGNTLIVEEKNIGITTASENIAEDVTDFKITRRRIDNNTLIDIYLKLDNGKESVEFKTSTLAQNLLLPRGNCW